MTGLNGIDLAVIVAYLIGVTLFGLLFTPVFYILVRTMFQSRRKPVADTRGVAAE